MDTASPQTRKKPHLRMRVRTRRQPNGRTRACWRTFARMYLRIRAPSRRPSDETLWGNGFSAFLARSALTSRFFGLRRRARL